MVFIPGEKCVDYSSFLLISSFLFGADGCPLGVLGYWPFDSSWESFMSSSFYFGGSERWGFGDGRNQREKKPINTIEWHPGSM